MKRLTIETVEQDVELRVCAVNDSQLLPQPILAMNLQNRLDYSRICVFHSQLVVAAILKKVSLKNESVLKVSPIIFFSLKFY